MYGFKMIGLVSMALAMFACAGVAVLSVAAGNLPFAVAFGFLAASIHAAGKAAGGR